MIYGIIFYDSIDGEMLYNTSCIDYNNIEKIIDNCYEYLNIEYKSIKNILYKLYDYNLYKDNFEKHQSVRVTSDGEIFFSDKEIKYRIGLKHSMTDRWYPLFEEMSGIYNKENQVISLEILTYYYNDFINYNLKNICKIVPFHFLHPNEIFRSNENNEKALVRWGEDLIPTLVEMCEELNINNCIFPFQVRKKNDSFLILDGSHKLIAMKELIKNDSFKIDRKILSIEFNSVNPTSIDNNTINCKLDNPITMHIPKLLLNKYHFINYLTMQDFDDNIMEVTVDRYIEMVTLFRVYILELTIPIRRYKIITGKTLSPFDFIEDEYKFKIWMEDDNE